MNYYLTKEEAERVDRIVALMNGARNEIATSKSAQDREALCFMATTRLISPTHELDINKDICRAFYELYHLVRKGE